MTTTLSLWDSLLSSALLGTERRPFVSPPLAEAVGKLIARLDSADAERALLGAAAIVALHRRAGQTAAVDKSPIPEPCEADDAPECSPHAGQHLALMLSGQYEPLLAEWLAAVATKGKRPPAEHLPALLDLGASKEALRESISAVLGKRGQWLVAQNGNWEFVIGKEAETESKELWETAGKGKRLALLKSLRQRDPDRARELLASTWTQEPPEDRAAFIPVLRTGLTLADEPFLEEALDDRRKEVRRAAADLLAQLPESRLCGRMAERVSNLVKWKKGKKPGFAVSLPEECDKAMERDGVQPKLPAHTQGKGEKAWWLSQMLNVAPLKTWKQMCSAPPDKIVEAAGRHNEWAGILLEGLVTVAARFGEVEWIEPLMSQKKVSNSIALFRSLPDDKKEKYVLKLLASHPSVKHGEPATPFLFACQHPWGNELSRAVIDAVIKDLTGGSVKYSYQLSSLLEIVARHLSPSLIKEAVARLPEAVKEKSAMGKEIDKFLGTAQFREEMLRAIRA